MKDEPNLKTEKAYFNANRDKWVAEGHGSKYAVIKGETVLGFFDDDESAYAAGLKAYGDELFMMTYVVPTGVYLARAV